MVHLFHAASNASSRLETLEEIVIMKDGVHAEVFESFDSVSPRPFS